MCSWLMAYPFQKLALHLSGPWNSIFVMQMVYHGLLLQLLVPSLNQTRSLLLLLQHGKQTHIVPEILWSALKLYQCGRRVETS